MEIDTKTLLWVARAMSKDTAHASIHGIMLEKDGALVATDVHRLHIAHTGVPATDVLIPGALVAALVELPGVKTRTDNVQIGVNGVTVALSMARNGDGNIGARFEAAESTGAFPNYKHTVPYRGARNVVLSTTARVMSRVLAKRDKAKIEFNPADHCMYLSDLDGTDRVKVSAEFAVCNDAETVGFNAKYLLDALAAYKPGDTVTLDFGTKLDAVAMYSQSSPLESVVMPVNL